MFLRAWSSFKTPMSSSQFYSHPLCTRFKPSKALSSIGLELHFFECVLVLAIKANQLVAKTPKSQLLRAPISFAHFEYTIQIRNIFFTKHPAPIFEFRPRFRTRVVRSWLTEHFLVIFRVFRAN